MTWNHHKEAHHPHSDPDADWREVVAAIDQYRPDWSDGVVGFSPNVDGVDGAADPAVDSSDGPILPNISDRTAADEIAYLIRNHTAARGIDLWAVQVQGYSASEWAEMTDRDRSTVARNVRRANETTQT